MSPLSLLVLSRENICLRVASFQGDYVVTSWQQRVVSSEGERARPDSEEKADDEGAFCLFAIEHDEQLQHEEKRSTTSHLNNKLNNYEQEQPLQIQISRKTENIFKLVLEHTSYIIEHLFFPTTEVWALSNPFSPASLPST